MDKILFLDDDFVAQALVKEVFRNEDFELRVFSKGQDALEAIKTDKFDIILSDLMMPEMSGEVFFSHVKEVEPDLPFVFITANDDLKTAVSVMKLGADEYLQKPLKAPELISCIKNTILSKKEEMYIKGIMLDKLSEQREKNGLVSWKRLYGMKDSNQANQVLSFLSKNIEQAGGFMWLDVLHSKYNESDENEELLCLKKTMVELIMESTDYISKILSDLKYVSSLVDKNYLMESVSLSDFQNMFTELYNAELIPVVASYKKKINLNQIQDCADYKLEINQENILSIFRELLYNAVKYSPDHSKIILHFDIATYKDSKILEISYWNNPPETILKDKNGETIFGIPYEYSESIFELFYTMDKYPSRIPEEEWSQGIGLYITKKMLQKMNGDINAKNITMHTLQKIDPFVKVTIQLPLIEN